MDWIRKENIRACARAECWQDAVKRVGNLMEASGFITPGYIQAMVETVEELGPYCVIAPGIAMPHARPDRGVLSSGFAALSLEKPLNFGNIDNDPVFLVVAFCAVNHETHIQALTQIARIISQVGFLDQVKDAGSDYHLYQILNGRQ